jgi:leader peptidase (prepilin peptidase)/N-methyltransferase
VNHLIYILFLFAVGACVGSFLNVVVWRLPRGESLVTPPSHCPKCERLLKWYDNVPVFGWLRLGGKCRFCGQPISARYPIVEALTGALFVFYYVMFFIVGVGPCAAPGSPTRSIVEGPALSIVDDWPMYALYMLLISALLAVSLIDAELFIIPIEVIWVVVAPIGVAMHTIIDTPRVPGALNASPAAAALAAGGGIGLLVTLAGGTRDRSVDHQGQEEPEPPEYTKAEVRAEIRKEMLFLLPPMVLGALFVLLYFRVDSLRTLWDGLMRYHWVTGFFGSLLGLLVGGFVVWLTRILGTLGFGREAMGMGDVHLMAGVGAVVGAGASTVAFFLAPFFGIILALYLLFTGKRRELPYGPYLSLATAFVLLFYCPIAAWLAPGAEGLRIIVGQLFGVPA